MNLSEIEVTEVSVHYGETKSLPDYSNVKPGYSLKATVKPGQDPEEVAETLMAECKRMTWEDCDAALEREGRRAHFWTGPRFDLRVHSDDWLAVIVPSEAELPKAWRNVHCPKSGWRLEALRKYIQEDYGKLTIADFSFEENLEALPELGEYEAIWLEYNGQTYCLLLPLDFDEKLLPEIWQDYRRTRHSNYTRLAANFLDWIEAQAKSKEAILINCLDGDLSKLPDLTPKDAPKVEIEPAFDEPIEDDDDDDWEDDDDYNEDED